LSKARKRFGVRVYEKFFQHIVRLCESAGLVEGDVLFIDSTLSKANAAPQSLRSRALLAQRLPDAGRFLSRKAATKYPAVINSQGKEKKVSASATDPTPAPVTTNEYAKAAPPTAAHTS